MTKDTPTEKEPKAKSKKNIVDLVTKKTITPKTAKRRVSHIDKFAREFAKFLREEGVNLQDAVIVYSKTVEGEDGLHYDTRRLSHSELPTETWLLFASYLSYYANKWD